MTKVLPACTCCYALRMLLLSAIACASLSSHALRVTISSANAEVVEVLESTLPVRRLKALEGVDGYSFWARRLRRDGAEALQSLGYYAAKVEVELSADQRISVNVNPGKPVRIEAVNIDLVNFPETADQPVFGIKQDDQLNHRQYEAEKQRIHSELIRAGYLAAELTRHRIVVNRDKHSAEIQLSWNVGPRYLFGETRFSGSTLTPQFLGRYIVYSPGDPLKESTLQDFSQRLRESGYFASVELIPLRAEVGENYRVPLEVRLQPVARSLYESGVSVGTDRGPGVDVGVTRRQSGQAGARWELKADASVQRQFIAGRYETPSAAYFGKTRLLDFNVVNEETDSSTRTSVRASASLQNVFRGWRRTYALSALNERFTIADEEDTSSFIIGSVELFRRKADDILHPTKGWRGRVELSSAGQALGSSTSFIQVGLNYKQLGPIGESGRWIARARLGAMWVDDFSAIPASLRFFAGGDHSVRGFDYQSLGPRNEDNEVIGGSYVIESTVEFDYRFAQRWRIAVFADSGNAFGDDGSASLQYSAGVGLRWLSPIGPLRLDFARPISDDDDGVRIHFSAGPDL